MQCSARHNPCAGPAALLTAKSWQVTAANYQLRKDLQRHVRIVHIPSRQQGLRKVLVAGERLSWLGSKWHTRCNHCFCNERASHRFTLPEYTSIEV